MDTKAIFAETFVETIKTHLDTVCADGSAITKSELAKALGLEPELESSVGCVISLGLVPGYDMRKGRGIGLSAEELAKREEVAQTDMATEFLELLLATLTDVCPDDGSCVPRKEIVAAMGNSGTKAETLVSRALKLDAFAGFATRPGRDGGVHKVVAEVPEAVEETKEVVTVEAAPDPVAELDQKVDELLAAEEVVEEVNVAALTPLQRHQAELRKDRQVVKE